MPASLLTGLSAKQLEALLAHELAHIRRYDYLVNLLQTTIETLFFYHPAAWWVSAQARQEREHCCDDVAVAACGDVLTYARALTTLEHLRGAEPKLAVAANGGSLLVRIQRLLRGRAPVSYGLESGVAGLIALATVVILLASAQTALLSRNTKAAAVRDAKDNTVLTDATQFLADQTAETAAVNINPQSPLADRVATQPHDALKKDEAADIQGQGGPSASEPPAQEKGSGESQDFASQMASAGLVNLRVNQLVALKVNGITSQYVREMLSAVSARLTVDRIVAMWVHGITSAYVGQLTALGVARLTADHSIKVQRNLSAQANHLLVHSRRVRVHGSGTDSTARS